MVRRIILSGALKLIPGEWKRRLNVHLGACNLRWSMEQMRRFGFNPTDVLDVGAFQGDWAKTCFSVWPQARITCVEPQDAQQETLVNLASQTKNIRFMQVLLGETDRCSVGFFEAGSGSSVLLGNQETSNTKPMKTIDTLIKSGEIPPPHFLKLDVQGYEIAVLEGWTKGFEQCEVIQCEISLLPLIPKAPLLHEVVAYLYNREFLMFDVTELIRSPSDGTIWQIDALFCRKDSPLRDNRVWRSPLALK
jgi:FkbM family methyltransferase